MLRRLQPALINAILETLQHPFRLEPDALRLLESYNWPGNIRELKGLLTRLLITCESGKAGIEDVQKILSAPAADAVGEPQIKNLADQELEIIRAAYKQHNGNISAVSRELGISRNTVYKKLKEARKIGSDR